MNLGVGRLTPIFSRKDADMANLGGLNLGGPDKNPATPPSGPAETAKPAETPAEGDAPEVTAGKAKDESANAEATDKQKDAGGVAEAPKTNSEISDAVAEADATLREDVAARWTSHPIQRYTVGDYHFVDGLLVLRTQEEADAFQAVYDGLPIYEQTRIQKIDVSAAEAMVRERLAAGGGATKGIDSSTGDRAPNKQVGTGSLIGE